MFGLFNVIGMNHFPSLWINSSEDSLSDLLECSDFLYLVHQITVSTMATIKVTPNNTEKATVDLCFVYASS